MTQFTVEPVGDTRIVVRRRFAAPPAQVWRAHVEPALIRQWMLGPPGWTMPVCISEPRPGGSIRYEWTNQNREGFHLTGEYEALEAPNLIRHVERMHMPDPTPDNHVETRFEPDGAGTLMTMTMTLQDRATRDQILATGMETGMEAGYERLEALIPAL